MENASTTKEAFNVPRLNVHDLVTNIIIEQLEKGVIPWQKPWLESGSPSLGLPKNQTTDNYYRGINIVLLWSSSIKNNYQTDDWASFKQWQAKKETIRKGEKGSLIVYYDTIEKEKDGEVQKIPFLKSSYVFNGSQLTSFVPPEDPLINHKPSYEKIEAVDQFILNTGAIIGHHDGGAKYNRRNDIITMPKADSFIETETCSATENYISTLFHELVHWSGAEHRLNRVKGKQFGDQAYANEELIAEFGASFLTAGFGLRTAEKGAHSGYIEHWLKILKEDNRCIFRVASEGGKAVDYLNSLQP